MKTAQFIAQKLVTQISEQPAGFLPYVVVDSVDESWLPVEFLDPIDSNQNEHFIKFHLREDTESGFAIELFYLEETEADGGNKFDIIKKLTEQELVRYLSLLFFHNPNVTLCDESDISLTYKDLKGSSPKPRPGFWFPNWYTY